MKPEGISSVHTPIGTQGPEPLPLSYECPWAESWDWEGTGLWAPRLSSLLQCCNTTHRVAFFLFLLYIVLRCSVTIHCLRIMCNDQINMIIIYRAREFCIVLALFGKTDSFEVAVLLQGLESKHVFLSPSCYMSVGLSASLCGFS